MSNFLDIDAHRADHWSAHARQWSRIGSPLRPHPDDSAAMRNMLREPRGKGLLLGVTPELMALGSDIVAIDRDSGMLAMLRGQMLSANAIQGNWLALPFSAGSFDFAIGDGSFNLLRYPHGYTALFKQLQGVLKPDAPVVLRIFTAPQVREHCPDIVAAAYGGQIESFHAFKWRLAMALAGRNGNPNIGVADIYAEFARAVPDRRELSVCTGWPLNIIDTIDVYRHSPAVYSFPTAHEWSMIAASHSREIQRAMGGYELAERCPIVCLRLTA